MARKPRCESKTNREWFYSITVIGDEFKKANILSMHLDNETKRSEDSKINGVIKTEYVCHSIQLTNHIPIQILIQKISPKKTNVNVLKRYKNTIKFLKWNEHFPCDCNTRKIANWNLFQVNNSCAGKHGRLHCLGKASRLNIRQIKSITIRFRICTKRKAEKNCWTLSDDFITLWMRWMC